MLVYAAARYNLMVQHQSMHLLNAMEIVKVETMRFVDDVTAFLSICRAYTAPQICNRQSDKTHLTR